MWKLNLQLVIVLGLCSSSFAQSAPQMQCLIVKHKGTVGRRLLWTALIGVPIAPGAKYDYVDSVNYVNAKMAFNGKELEALQKSMVHVIVLDNKYKAEDLDSARNSCKNQAPIAQSQGSQPNKEKK